MCGVAAILGYHYAAPAVDREELRTIRDQMRARGPDGSREWYSDDGRVGLGHRRLSIIDLSDAAAQPMASGDGMLRVSYNGEIYNHRELRSRLEQRGVRFRTQSDTEVLLGMYEHYGVQMFQHLRGMYAFVIWDARKNAMLVARDPYGIKPLYLNDDGWTVRIASQVKALLASPRVSREPEPAGQVGFYLFGSVPEPYTTWLHVRAVPAGCYQWIGASGPKEPVVHTRVSDAWSAPAQVPDATRFADAVRDSIRAHRVSDVPVGAFLSAGIDSTALVACMAGDAGAPLVATTIAFDEFAGTSDDEAPLASDFARRHGVDHSVRVVTESEFRTDLPRILDAMDQPSIDGINTWFVAKAARERGLKVAVSGVGGDELLGGYPSFRDVPRWVRACAIPTAIPGLGKLARLIAAPALSLAGASEKAAGMLELGGRWPGAYLLRRGLFMPWELPRVLPKDTVHEGLRRLRWPELIESAMPRSRTTDYGRVAAMESQLYMRNQLLRDTDWASMAHSLEVRTPLVDAELLRSVAPMLRQLTPGEGKRWLAATPPTALPDAIRSRRKTGFSTPVGRWLQRSGLVATAGGATGPVRAGYWSRRLAHDLFRASLA